MLKGENLSRTMVRFICSFADSKHFTYLIYKHLKSNNTPEIRNMICTKFLGYHWTSNVCKVDI